MLEQEKAGFRNGYGYSYSYKPAAGAHRLLDHESPVGEARRHDVPREDGKPDKPVTADAPAPASAEDPPAVPEPHPVLAEVLSEYSPPVASPIPPWQPDLLEPLAPAPASAPPTEPQAPSPGQASAQGQAPAVTPTGHVTTVYPDVAEAPGHRTDPAPDQRG